MITKITESKQNQATIKFDKDGFSVKFSKTSTPKFVQKVAILADEFVLQKDIENDDFETFALDSFERLEK